MTFRPPLDFVTIASAVIIAMMIAVSAAFGQPMQRPDAPVAPSSPDKVPLADPITPSETLSEKLDKQDGVLKPPANVDHSIVKPPPPGGVTPVIPPPGTPGGDQSVKPE